jgi:hypothetical protein
MEIPAGQLGAGGLVLPRQPGHDVADGQHLVDAADSLPGAPDVLPGLDPGRAEVHGGLVGVREPVGIEPGGDDARAQVVAVHAGEGGRVDDVGRLALHHHPLVALRGVGLVAGDEPGPHVGEVRPHGLGGEDAAPGRDGPRQRQRALEEAAHLGDQRERAQGAGVPAGPGAHQDQPVHPGLQRLLGVAHVDDVVEHQAAVAVNGLDDPPRRPQAGDDDGHPVLHAQVEVVIEPVVRFVDDLVDREGRHLRSLVLLPVPVQRIANLEEPLPEQLRRPGVQGREGADDAARALRDHQPGLGEDEHGGADDGQRHLRPQPPRHRRFSPGHHLHGQRPAPRGLAGAANHVSGRASPRPGAAQRVEMRSREALQVRGH